jgi:hypothetical protein
MASNSLYDWSDRTKIGVVLTSMGGFFMFLGVVMLLDSAMLTIGNLLFISGVVMIMGLERCQSFFFAPHRRRATACFAVGIVLVVLRWCFVGLLVQGFGMLNLFGNFFPMALNVLEMTPVVGPLVRSDAVQRVLALLRLSAPERSV